MRPACRRSTCTRARARRETRSLLDGASAAVLGFEWLAGAVAPVSPYGERVFSDVRAFGPGERDGGGGASRFDRPLRRRARRRSARCAARRLARSARRGDGDRARRDGRRSRRPGVSGAAAFLRSDRSHRRADARRSAAFQDRQRGRYARSPPRLRRGVASDGAFYLADAFDAELAAARERARARTGRARRCARPRERARRRASWGATRSRATSSS